MAPPAGYDRPAVTDFPTVRVAAIQATPVILDLEASVAKAERLLAEAAADGVRLVELPGPAVGRLAEACREHDLVCAIGVNEREAERPGTLYNALLVIGPEGLISKHRKLMPTHHERLFHGIGAGDDLAVADTPAGRVGGLICWENRMPLARWAVYSGGPQIWIAPTADDSDGWIASMRHIAIESGAYVVSAPQFIPRAAFPADFPLELPDKDVLGRGGACIAEPAWGELIAGPLYGEEGMVVADCDLRRGLHAKRWFDAVGHYGRTDVLTAPSAVALDELLGHLPGDVVGVLLGRRLHQVGARAHDRAAEAVVKRQLAAPHRVGDDARRVRRVPHLELHLGHQRHVAEGLALEPDVGPLAVGQPRHVVRGADVHVVGGQLVAHDRGHGLGLGDLLRLEPLALEHVEEVHVAADVQLRRALELDAAVAEQPGQGPVDDRRADLGLDVVADDRQAGLREAVVPVVLARDEHRDAVHERAAGLEHLLDVPLGRL